MQERHTLPKRASRLERATDEHCDLGEQLRQVNPRMQFLWRMNHADVKAAADKARLLLGHPRSFKN